MIPGTTAPPEVAAARKTAAHFVWAPMPRRVMAKMREKMPDSKRSIRQSIVTAWVPVRVMARMEAVMAPVKRRRRV